jgi:hypothetical protein
MTRHCEANRLAHLSPYLFHTSSIYCRRTEDYAAAAASLDTSRDAPIRARGQSRPRSTMRKKPSFLFCSEKKRKKYRISDRFHAYPHADSSLLQVSIEFLCLSIHLWFSSFLPSLWSSSNHRVLGSRSRDCYAIKSNGPKTPAALNRAHIETQRRKPTRVRLRDAALDGMDREGNGSSHIHAQSNAILMACSTGEYAPSLRLR